MTEYLAKVLSAASRESVQDLEACFDRLWPLMRSITGDGVRKTHDILGKLVPLQRIEIPSGTQVYDWTIPAEWVFRDAYIIAPSGDRILNAKTHPLHLVNYSIPFQGVLNLRQLQEHLYSIPELPEAIPYVTSYYLPRWGFCLAHEMRERLEEGDYHVVVDCDHIDGSLTLSEVLLRGESSHEVLFSTYTCHPGMANNELSGPLVAAFLYRRLASLTKRRLTYRFVFLPETIGSIAYLARMGQHLKKHLIAGYVVSCVGDPGPFTYKASRNGSTLADRAATYSLRLFSGAQLRIQDFWPDGGSDERQYCSPGFDLPVGVISRSIFGSYREYHTSLDNKDFMSFEAMSESVDAHFVVCSVLERNLIYERSMPYCEPHLSKYNLYSSLGAPRSPEERKSALLWLLNLADGKHDLLSIAERAGVNFWLLDEVAGECVRAGIIRIRDSLLA